MTLEMNYVFKKKNQKGWVSCDLEEEAGSTSWYLEHFRILTCRGAGWRVQSAEREWGPGKRESLLLREQGIRKTRG
jgi:hypothetical protein